MKELQEMRLHFKRLSKGNFLKRGEGGMREEEEQTERVSVKRACVIAVTSSLRALHLFSCALQKGVADAGRWGEQPRRCV